MKKVTLLLTAFVFFATTNIAKAQTDKERECQIKYNLFKGDFNSKKYDEAYTNWIYLMDNCQDLSINIYKYGAELAQDVRKDPALAKRVYTQRLQYFPNDDEKIKNNIAKVHSDYAEYLFDNNLGTAAERQAILQKAYEISPEELGVKNTFRYFEGVTEQYKDSDPQRVFDTYDVVMDAIGKKLENYAEELKKLTGDSTKTLTKKEQRYVKFYSVNSKSYGQIEGGLDNIISEIATCERLIPLYSRDFEANKNDATWLKRAVSRMFNKGCQDDALFEKIARAYADAAPSSDSYSFVSTVLENNGDSKGAAAMKEKAFNLETDPIKKAKYKLQFAEAAKNRGQLSTARSLAREALQYNPNYGRAYIFIGFLYQSSVNSCGESEFEKRMVYAAALRMMQKAAAVDPSVAVSAGRYAANFRANLPSKSVIFTAGKQVGQSYTIGCWIGETVTIQASN